MLVAAVGAAFVAVSCGGKNTYDNNIGPGGEPEGTETTHKGPRAVFIGDSITWQWTQSRDIDKSKFDASITLPSPLPSYMEDKGAAYHVTWHPAFFTANGYVNKGVSAQRTDEMLARFKTDVLDQDPHCVVIMGGTNDLAQGYAKDVILSNIKSMAEQAAAKNMKVVLCSVTPCNMEYSRLSPKGKGTHIKTLNTMIKEYAVSKGFAYCDYFPALVAGDGLALKEEFCLYDRLHPNPDAYYLMEDIIKPIIDKLLK